MKKLLKGALILGASLFVTTTYAQLLDEKNVQINMDLQPVLQLKMDGPDQIDMSFTDIQSYYAGITKYGANVLKVSSSVSFDLWAVGLSQNATDYLWDQQVDYQGGGASGINSIPLTALELHQFPGNPIVGNPVCDFYAAGAANISVTADYSQPFTDLQAGASTTVTAGSGNNCIYSTSNSTPYAAPQFINALGTADEKYIAGGDGTDVGCSVVGGTYLQQTMGFNTAAVAPATNTTAGTGTPNAAGYYFVMDYRVVPGLPAIFPMHEPENNANGITAAAGHSLFDADAVAAVATLGETAGVYAAPGIYSMYVKYILAEDQ